MSLYRAAMHAYPESFRRRYEAEAVASFQESCERRLEARDFLGFVRFVLMALGDAVLSGILERFGRAAIRKNASASRWTAAATDNPAAESPGKPTPELPVGGSGERRPSDRLVRDLRYAARSIITSPGISFLIIVTLALGIGASSAIFSVVNAVLLRPLPYPESERLVHVFHTAPGITIVEDLGLTDATYFFFRDRGTLENLAIYEEGAVNLSTPESPIRVRSAAISHSLLAVLGTPPALGRAFHEDDETPGAPPAVIVSETLWRERLGARHEAIGSTVRVDGATHEVVGVMPAGFGFPSPETDVWLPMTLDPQETDIGRLGTEAVGLLRPEMTATQAQVAMAGSLGNLEETFPVEQGSKLLADAGFTVVVENLRERIVGDVEPVLWVLLGSVGFVLAIACANVGNLFLVWAEGREREMAIRSAIGASRFDLVKGFVTESATLSVAAGSLGLGAAWTGVRALVRFGPRQLPRLEEIGIDLRVIGFAVIVSASVGLVFGLIPALRYRSRWLPAALKGSGKGHTGDRSRHRARSVLVVTQLALALVLLVGSGLMLRSFLSLSSVDLGFDPDDVLTFGIFLPESDYPGDQAPAAFVQRFLDELAGLPGVRSVGAVSDLPLGETGDGSGVSIEDHPDGPDGFTVHLRKYTAPGYFETMGIPLLAGRSFERRDLEQRTAAVIVNHAFARRYWPDGNALGKRLQPRNGDPDPELWYTIVGVVGSVRNLRLEDDAPEIIYYPLLAKVGAVPGCGTTPDSPPCPWEARQMSFAIRSDGDPIALAQPARQLVHSLDDDLPIANVRSMEWWVRQRRGRIAFTTTTLLTGAAGALLIGVVGIYGVISYVVSRQTREIGVRKALGARNVEIKALVLRRSALITASGIVVGLAGAAALTRFLESLLFEVTSLDAATFISVTAGLAAVAGLASYLPARRAARVDPLVTMRLE